MIETFIGLVAVAIIALLLIGIYRWQEMKIVKEDELERARIRNELAHRAKAKRMA